MKAYIILILSIFLSVALSSQPLNTLKYETMLEIADESFEKRDYDNALDYYSQAFDEQQDPVVLLRMAETHFMMRNYPQTRRILKRLLVRDRAGVYNDYRLLYAKSLKRIGEYKEAYDEFKEYYQKTDDPEGRKEALLEVKGLELFGSLKENIEMEFKPLDNEINKGFSIYGIQRRPNDEMIYFGSFDAVRKIVLDGKTNEVKEQDKKKSKKDSRKKSDDDDDTGSTRGQIMMSKRDNKGEYEKASSMDLRFNQEDYHSIYPAFSTDGNRMFFTRMAMEGTVILESKILYSEYRGSDWTAPSILPVINGDFQSKMPAFGEILGREALFFVSDMSGGKGGFDVYYSLINSDGSLELPVNLGDGINTRDDEITPFFVDGKLYFSSNGHPGLGGFDIFETRWTGSEWSTPENMGKGFNSSVDDLGLSLSEDGRSGFLLSNRPYDSKRRIMSTTCCDHVFRISARDLIIQLIVDVIDEDGPVNDATVQLVDKSRVNPLPPESKSNFSGNLYNFSLEKDRPYEAIVSKEGYNTVNIPFTTAGIFDDFTINKTAVLEKAAPEFEIIKINEPIRLNNIYYDFDDYKILPEAEEDLERLLEIMNKYPDMVIELSSHTDSRASQRYNLGLSQKRAESAKQWLVQNDIDPDRIVAKGYGKSKILNHCTDNVECTEEEHRLNRRTEFTILEGPTQISIEKKIFKSKD